VPEKSGVSQRIFVKFPSIKRSENSPSRSRTDTCGQKDRQKGGQRHDEANERFSLFLRTRLIKSILLLNYTAWQLRLLPHTLCFTFFLHDTTPPPFQLTLVRSPPYNTEFSCQKLASNCIQPRPWMIIIDLQADFKFSQDNSSVHTVTRLLVS